MMNEKTINEQYAYISILLQEKRLKEALTQLESLLWQCADWKLRTHLEQLQTSYNYMLDYMRQGADDPERPEVYRKLLKEAWEIADRARLFTLDGVSSKYYHIVRHTAQTTDSGTNNPTQTTHILEGFNDDLAISGLQSDEKIDEALKRHENALKTLFLNTWTNSGWSDDEEKNAQAMLTSELSGANDLCLFASAVTLSLMECFDLSKAMWLLDAYTHPNVSVSQRAVVGLLIVLHIYRNRIYLYPELIQRIVLMGDTGSFKEDVARIYRQLLLAQETEKIDKKMREEIIPEMMKSVSSIRDMRFGLEESDDESDDKNPDWMDAFEQSGLGDKLREMSELQMEGADVYMSTFAALKNFPFFREIHNWFYPFSKQQPDVYRILKDAKEKKGTLDFILETGFFSNSDKYSFLFIIQQLPKAQKEMLLSQLSSQQEQISEMAEQSNAENIKQFNERPGTISNQYLQDLYRFFKLSTRRQEFRDFFKEKLDLHHIPALSNMLSQKEVLFPIADFYLKKERWEEATEAYKEMEAAGLFAEDAAECYQKLGYARQKQKKYAEAIEAYLKADTLKPDNVWNNRHLAVCYRLNRDYRKALTYYKKTEEVSPEDTKIVFHIGSCLAELGQTEEALNYFFKLDFIQNNSIKAWRGIGWCSFIGHKHEQAMKYYEKIIDRKPLAIDYMNAGHVAWAMGNIRKAADLYKEAIAAGENKEQFIIMFRKDEAALLEQGIRAEDIPLMLDLL